jgi:hypothetical protein
MPRSRSSFRKALTQSKMRSNACAASRGNSLSSCRSGPRRQSWKPIRRCRRVVSHLRDLRSGDRRRAPVRYAKTADVLRRPCPGGELDRRYDPTEGPHIGRQPARAAGVGRGGLDISLSSTSQRHLESPARRTAEARARHRLEGADPTMRPLSTSQRDRQESFRSSWLRLLARWPRSFGLSDGRSRRHKGDGLFLPLPIAGSGARKVGNSRR